MRTTSQHIERASKRLVSHWATLSVLLLAMLVQGARAQENSPTEFPVIRLQAGLHIIQAELGATPEQRSRGLMFRKSLGTNQGMAFVFDTPGLHCMWMRNTYVPLSVAFLAEDGSIINIADMQPRTENSHCATRPARYALEMNQGWFKKRGIATGTRITGLPRP